MISKSTRQPSLRTTKARYSSLDFPQLDTMMKNILLLAAALAVCAVDAYAPQSKVKVPSSKPAVDVKHAVASVFTVATLASNVFLGGAPPAQATDFAAAPFSSNVVAVKETREGLYGTYDVEVETQTYDDARSTFKPAKEVKSKKGKYTALIAVLVVGSFIIPMAQYFWYVKDDSSSDEFFAPDPEPEPKKKGWFGK